MSDLKTMDWRMYARLFTNGKFKARDKRSGGEFFIKGIHGGKLITPSLTNYFNLSDCILIARPTSNMSHAERQAYESKLINSNELLEQADYTKQNPFERKTQHKSPESFLYLIDIGVLDHEKFDTTNVEWKNG